MQIDSTVLLAVEPDQIFGLFGSEFATESFVLGNQRLEEQVHEKLALLRDLDPHFEFQGLLYCGYGLDPHAINVPNFCCKVILVEPRRILAFQRSEWWVASPLQAVKDPITQIALENALQKDTELAMYIFQEKISKLQDTLNTNDFDDPQIPLRAYSNLKKLTLKSESHPVGVYEALVHKTRPSNCTRPTFHPAQ